MPVVGALVACVYASGLVVRGGSGLVLFLGNPAFIAVYVAYEFRHRWFVCQSRIWASFLCTLVPHFVCPWAPDFLGGFTNLSALSWQCLIAIVSALVCE